MVNTTFPPAIVAKGLDRLKSDGLFELLDTIAYLLIRKLRRSLYRWHRPRFGIKEALFWGKYVDKWHRYNAVLTKIVEITKDENSVITILEAGCGNEGLAEFYPDINNDSYAVDSLDVLLTESARQRKYPSPFRAPIIGDACCLPFSDCSKDFVMSLDGLEHVPEHKRQVYLRELVRVATKGVLLTCPVQCDGDIYLGNAYDAKYQRWHIKRFGKPNATISEHISLGTPSVSELKDLLPGCEISGVLNAETWFKCMTLSCLPLLGQLTGLWFLMFGAEKASKPPYYGGFVYLQK